MRRRTPHVAVSMLGVLLVAACSTTEALNPAAIQPVEPTPSLAMPGPGVTLPAPLGPPAGAAVPPAAALPPPVVPAGIRLQFAPVVGATVAAATPLSQRLAVRAADRGIAITAGGANPPTHYLKGYFAAFSEGKETIVIFVWDILGPQGNRLHRIQGQERVAAVAADPWAVVPPQTMETIAERTIADLALWLASRQG